MAPGYGNDSPRCGSGRLRESRHYAIQTPNQTYKLLGSVHLVIPVSFIELTVLVDLARAGFIALENRHSQSRRCRSVKRPYSPIGRGFSGSKEGVGTARRVL